MVKGRASLSALPIPLKEIKMSLLNDVKTSLRITHNALDTDLQAEIDSCKDDLKRVGWLPSKVVDTDVRVIEACKLYAKGRYDYQGKGVAYMQAYEDFRDATALNLEYTEAANV